MNLVFSDTVMEIFTKYIPNNALWITHKLKTAIKRNARIYRNWVKRGRIEEDHEYVREVQNSTNKLIRQSKQSYYNKLGINCLTLTQDLNILECLQPEHK